MTYDNEKIAARASQMYDAFEQRTRDNGETFHALREGSPEWMTEVIHSAHGDMFPDDWRYDLIGRVLASLSETRDDVGDDRGEIVDGAVDVCTTSLTAWLASSVHRLAYCDEAAEEFGAPESMSKALAYGQYAEIDEIFGQLLDALNEAEAPQ